ncbi:MAG: family transcriptional regulator [Ferruginibacter sp.]|nr:family transcriptional regulator [Ferruginibacter sp.]
MQIEDDEDIVITLDVMLAKRKMTLSELAARVDAPLNRLSLFKNGNAAVIKIKLLMRICKVLKCTPNDIFYFREKGAAEPDFRIGKGWDQNL